MGNGHLFVCMYVCMFVVSMDNGNTIRYIVVPFSTLVSTPANSFCLN